MKKINMIIILITIIFSNIYAAENININITTEVGCNTNINISSSVNTEELISIINSKYSGYNINNLRHNSVALESQKTLEEQNIQDNSTITLESTVEHKYVEQGVTKLPTCNMQGEKTLKCSVCGATKVVPVNSLGHALDSERIVNPTCIKDGVKILKCIRCDYEVKSVLPRTGHVYGVWDVVKVPTCKEEGKLSRKCVKCGKIETSVSEKIEHDIIEERISPTCTKPGYVVNKCSYNCGYIENKTQIPKLGHKMTQWKTNKEPTLVEEGEKIRKCKNGNCDYVETKKIPSLATGGNQTEVVDGIVEELKKDENRGKLFVIIGIIILPIIYIVIRYIYMVEKSQIKKSKKVEQEKKISKEKKDQKVSEKSKK